MKSLSLTAMIWAVMFAGCATSPGDTPECPECDNVTELLVGFKCVPIDQVEECGPDGHLHGADCHCFSGQDPTTIGGTDYCLQDGCKEIEVDIDALACGEIDETPEPVTPVTDFADFEDAHADLERVVEVDLPDSQESFLHFPGMETAEYAVYLDTTGVLDAVLDASETVLTAHAVGANPDCSAELPEVWHVEVVNDTGSPKPQIIRFKAGTVDKVKLVVYQLPEE
jgi:hypothetical protein